MKLDRNQNPPRGKYALIKLRQSILTPRMVENCKKEKMLCVVETDAIDFGDTPDTDFFVIRLKDKYAAPALQAYAIAAHKDDPEYANEIVTLANIADSHPNKRKPD